MSWRDGVFTVDRREAYYERVAPLVAKNPVSFYARAERGRRVQAAIKPKDLAPFKAPPRTATKITDIRAARRLRNGRG